MEALYIPKFTVIPCRHCQFMELPEEEDEDCSFDMDGQEHLEMIDTSWIDETTPKDEVDLVVAFKSRVRSYTRKRTPEDMEYGRAYVNAPGGRWITDDNGERKWLHSKDAQKL
mmetsp:Transcript_29153/g.73203  ORF Transcript_29153/g.73203 Transcript_29153/m.73203 type:complete len:113 (+) Transcript_29153:1-339(+)